MITIFTPTYNRAYIIDKLYKSLCLQTNQHFEWLIVDDGSTDDTELLVQSFINEKKLLIRYFKQPNGGKHRAINKGVKEANGDFFFIVDSDDQLTVDAIEQVYVYSDSIKEEQSFAGVSGMRFYPSGERIGGDFNFEVLDCSALEVRFKYSIKGDMSEIYKTDILRKYPFPEFENEKFCPEAVVWNRIACNYKLRYFNKKIYLCDYLNDGLTAKIVKIRMQSPNASMLCYSELTEMNIPSIQKIKSSINYWRFSFCSDLSFFDKIKTIGIKSLPILPFAYLLHLKDKK